jgi:hypothetical protein
MRTPVIMLAGGSSTAVASEIESYSALLRDAFRDLRCTLISGGTRAGVSVLAGDLGQEHGERLTVIGYLPGRLPDDVEVDDDPKRYHELRRTTGRDFSVLEPVQAWRDVLSGGVSADQVAVLGIGGGKISAAEYRLGLALGARCGLVAGSGGSADELLREQAGNPSVTSLPTDAGRIRDFLAGAT